MSRSPGAIRRQHPHLVAVLPVALRALVVLGLVFTAACIGPARADAHANLRSAVPAPNASTDGAPSQVQLHFGQPTIPDPRTRVSVLIPSGRDVAEGAAITDGLGVAQRLAAASEKGWYRVRYSVVFVDGHVGTGAFRFRVSTFDKSPPSHARWMLVGGGVWILFLMYAVLGHARRMSSSDSRRRPTEPAH